MAITRTQQARQMLKKGSKKPVVQGGVDNYLGDQPQVVVPRKWQSGPNKPPTELAYITEAEKKLLLKEDIHGSLKEGPNKGPGGVMSLDSFGDIGGAGAGGADTDPGGGYDTGAGGGGFSGQGPGESKQEFEDRKEQQKKDLEKFEKDQADYFKSEELMPNSALWAYIFGLVKDGIMFSFMLITCKAQQASYDSFGSTSKGDDVYTNVENSGNVS